MIKYLYDETGIIGLEYNNEKYYYVKNLQGDVTYILDSNYDIVANYTYSSWGEVTIGTPNGSVSNNPNHIANINPIRYRGYYYDTETELYYLNSRYYNPKLGRFINADEILGANGDITSYNLYSYVSNNPTNFTDALGNYSISIIHKSKNNYTIRIFDSINEKGKVVTNIYDLVVQVSAKGVSLSFLQYGSRYANIVKNGLQKALAEGILLAYKAQNKKTITGRTVQGLATELNHHYQMYVQTKGKKGLLNQFLYKHAKICDMEVGKGLSPFGYLIYENATKYINSPKIPMVFFKGGML